MRGVELDLHVQNRGQTTQALCAYAQGVDFFVQLQAHVFHRRQSRAAAGLGLQFVHVQIVHQTFFGHQRGFFGGAANTNTQHAGRTPARAHGGHGFEHPVDHRVAGVEHDQLALVLAAAAFGRHGDFQFVARHQFGEDHGGRVVLGVFAQELGVGHHAGAQGIARVLVGAAHAFVDGVIQTAAKALPAHIHADFEEDVDDAGVLAHGPVPGRAHLAIGQNLRNRVFGGRALLAGVGARQVGNVVRRVVVADVLQRGGNGLDQVGLADGGAHGCKFARFAHGLGWDECSQGPRRAICGLLPG